MANEASPVAPERKEAELSPDDFDELSEDEEE